MIKDRLRSVLNDFKISYEDTRRGDSDTKIRKIRSGQIIKIIEQWCMDELILEGINPRYLSSNFKAKGFFKTKEQDVSVMCRKRISCDQHRNIPAISINVRSQLSSIQKNYDTLYERAVAEVLNLHLVDPTYVGGFLWLLPLWGYDPDSIKKGILSLSEQYNRAKYIKSLELLNGRNAIDDKEWKYERMCLLLVNFKPEIPEPIIGLPESKLDSSIFDGLDVSRIWKCLDYRDFFSDLVAQAKERYYGCMPFT